MPGASRGITSTPARAGCQSLLVDSVLPRSSRLWGSSGSEIKSPCTEIPLLSFPDHFPGWHSTLCSDKISFSQFLSILRICSRPQSYWLTGRAPALEIRGVHVRNDG